MFTIKIDKEKILRKEKEEALKSISFLMCLLSFVEDDDEAFKEIKEILSAFEAEIEENTLKVLSRAIIHTPTLAAPLTDSITKAASAIYSILKDHNFLKKTKTKKGGQNEVNRRTVDVKMQGMVTSSNSGNA